jgi:hypothetical protein
MTDMPRKQKYTHCEDCLSPLVTQPRWNAASPDERREMLAEGYRKQGVGPTCTRCRDRRANAAA